MSETDTNEKLAINYAKLREFDARQKPYRSHVYTPNPDHLMTRITVSWLDNKFIVIAVRISVISSIISTDKFRSSIHSYEMKDRYRSYSESNSSSKSDGGYLGLSMLYVRFQITVLLNLPLIADRWSRALFAAAPRTR